MRIVVALPYAPWPIERGTDRLIMNLLEGLSASHEVALVTMALGRDELARLEEIENPRITVRGMLAPHRRSLSHRLYYKARNLMIELFRAVPSRVSYAAPPALLRLIADTAREFDADLVFASYWHLYRLPEYIEAERLVLMTHDLDFLVNPERMRMQRRGIGRPLAALRTRMLERIEWNAYSRFETIVTVTEADAEVMRNHPLTAGTSVHSLPLALDLSVFDPSTYRREQNSVLLMGAFHADFNIDAFRFFVNEVLPLVLERYPECRLDVVGQGVSADMRRIAPPAVRFRGLVESVIPYLGRCSLMVLPMRYCGGVRIRMLEAAAMGTPVVSTSVGVAGMGLAAGEDYLEADSAEAMAEAITRLLGDENEAMRLGKNARGWAEEHISMDTYPARLNALLEKLARSR
jgi:glycosyltransferase involved in cell wall biosynthesis